MDNNGLDDIIVLTHSGNNPNSPANEYSHLHVFKSTGSSWTQFSGWPSAGYQFHYGYCLGVPAAGDVHPNGYMDVIVGGEDSTLYCFRPTTSNQPVWTKTLTGVLNSPITIGDLDTDGRKEIILTAVKSNKLYIIGYDGFYWPGWQGGKNVNVTDPYGSTSPPIIGNMDADGYLEIALVGRDSVYIFEHTGDLKTNWPKPINNGDSFFDPYRHKLSNSSSPALADLNVDGIMDLIFVTTFGIIHGLNCQSGNEIKGFPVNLYFDYINSHSPLIDDIDNDGDLELAFIGHDANLRSWDDPNQYPGSPAIEWSQAYGNIKHTGEYGLTASKSSYVLSKITDDRNAIPKEFKLEHNFPNPFNPVTTIKYQLPKDSKVKLEIFNVLGQKIKTLINKQEEAAYYEVLWNGINDLGNMVASGVYVFRFSAEALDGSEDFIDNGKMLLVK